MKYKILFGDPIVGEEAKKHILESINNQKITSGPKVEEYQNSFRDLFGYKYNIATSSGTAADVMACMSLYPLGAKRGDEIIAPALAFAAVGNSILQAGFKPIFVDIEKETLNINPNKIEDKITDKTKAIMAVHTMGRPCNMEVITDIAKKHTLTVIEDSCEAYGAIYNEKMVGHWGDVATFSSYAAHLIFTGEGGMVSTNNEELASYLSSIRSHGRPNGSVYFDHQIPGSNFKMTDLQAGIGLESAKDFWNNFEKRRDNIEYLLSKTLDLNELAWFNSSNGNEVISPHAFSITLKDPSYGFKNMYNFLESKGIQCKLNFGSMPTQHKAFSKEFIGLDNCLGDFPESEYVGKNGLHFGIHQKLTKDDLDHISESLHTYFSKFKDDK